MLDLENRLAAHAIELKANERRRRWKQEWKEGGKDTARVNAVVERAPCPQPPCPEQARHPLGRLVSAFARRPS